MDATTSKTKTERVLVMFHYDWSDGESDTTWPLSTDRYVVVLDRLGLPHATTDEWATSMAEVERRAWESIPQSERGQGSGQHYGYVEVPLPAGA